MYDYSLYQNLDWYAKGRWQSPDTPFMSIHYWQALTQSRAIGQHTGWLPVYIVINATNTHQPKRQTQLQPLAVIPLFIKNNHQGEYVFDHSWAQAYAQYGENYYPRLVTSVPYTPITGQRLWLADGVKLSGAIINAVLSAVDDVANNAGASSWHGLFLNPSFTELALTTCDSSNHQVNNVSTNTGIDKNRHALKPRLLERQGNQFLWHNRNLTRTDSKGHPDVLNSFEDFLSTLTAKKRKNIKAERRKIAKQNLTCRLKVGKDLTTEDWEVFYKCYAMTYMVRGRNPYLSPAFFKQIGDTMRDHIMLAQASDANGEVVASSLFFYDSLSQKDATLYGRYWGALKHYDSLHFELCYYQGIEFAIQQGLKVFDPGTQGEHKLIRGFVPTKTFSVHRIYNKKFEPAIAHFCQQDRDHMQQYRLAAHQALPFNADNIPEFKG